MRVFKHLKSDWFRYGFETIAVVVGILIAFALDNWKEQRKQDQVELKTLIELRNALQSDLDDMISNAEGHESVQRSCELLIVHIEQDLPYHDSLALHFGSMPNQSILLPQTGPYETLKTMGLDLISNDSIPLLLSTYYEERIPFARTFEEVNKLSWTDTRNMMFQHFEEWNLFGAAIPYDYEELKQDREFLSYMKHIVSARRVESGLFRRSLAPIVEQLIHDIEVEIEQHSPTTGEKSNIKHPNS